MDAEKTPTGGELIVYQTDDGRVKLDVRLQDETIWLTQADLAELFQVKPQNITIHLKNIYAEGELQEDATCKEFLQVQTEGVREVQRIRKLRRLNFTPRQSMKYLPTIGEDKKNRSRKRTT